MKHLILLMFAATSVAISKRTHQLIIPKSENYPYAKLYGTIDHPLVEYTLCHWSRLTVVQENATVFSYTVADIIDDAILTVVNDKGGGKFFQMDDRSPFTSDFNTLYWHHLCVTSSSIVGTWTLYLNGMIVQSGIKQNGPIPPNGIVALGQDPKLTVDDFHHQYKFAGVIADVFLWDRVLSPEEISEVYACNHTDDANVINWHLHSWELFNGARMSSAYLPCGKPVFKSM